MLSGLSLLFYFAGVTLRPYAPPALGPEPAVTPSGVVAVEVMPANGEWDANVFARPIYTAPLVGSVARGTRVRVKGELKLPYAPYCDTDLYYALEPFGWLCSADAQPTSQPLTVDPVLQLVPGTNVPYRYVMVVVEEGTFIPMWGSLDQLRLHAEPERQLGRGDTLALMPDTPQTRSVEEFEGQKYYVTIDNKVVPVAGTADLKSYSEWQGIGLGASTHFPFGWVTPSKAPVYDAVKGKKLEDLPRRTQVDILEEIQDGHKRWVRIGEGRYMKADHLNEVRKVARPENTGAHAQWVDVDLGEQVVVAYRGDQPEFATLTSSGRAPNNTPRGNYPIWGKVTAITMKSQSYDDAPYYVNRVPWVMFFQAHNALHAAYWHDRFGATKSHGCANLSPKDARYLFDWLEPRLPPGWTSVRYWDLTQAPVVHVHNSSKIKPFAQERNVGPPDKDDEAARLADALARREEQARLAAEQAAQPVIQAPLAAPVPLAPQGPQMLPSPLLR